MKVKVKKLHKSAVIPFKTYDGDFCYDVIAVSEKEISTNVWRYEIGLSFQIERDIEVFSLSEKCTNGLNISTCFDIKNSPIILSIDLRPRSSVWKTGMILSNCEGTIDELYTGGVCAVFYHVIPNMPRYEVGDRIGQIKIGFTLPIQFEELSELLETKRGDKGYGSTGM